MLISFISASYKHLAKPVFFLFDPEDVHNFTTTIGDVIGKSDPLNSLVSRLFSKKPTTLKQNIAGIEFKGPMGLAAGFDYEAKTAFVLPSLGFGFNTVGTITNYEYEGNPKPRLGRLPKSKSLMVNKGLKNEGALAMAKKLSNKKFKAPLGISIGKSNIAQIDTQEDAIRDIISAFKIFENTNVDLAYYELNISCPNLYGKVTFYKPEYLNDLLIELETLKVTKPIFVKMPISLTNDQTLKLLDIISKHKIAGVIFGNTQNNKKDEAFDKNEVRKWNVGHFTGIPTQKRSNELIKLSYKNYGKKLIIIGCGGVFSTKDAYEKIKLGASLVQLITGLIYEGPLLVARINQELPSLLKKDGFKNITEAIGSQNRG